MYKILRAKKRAKKKNDNNKEISFFQPLSEEWKDKPLFSALADNRTAFEELFKNCSDIVFRDLTIYNGEIPVILIFIKEIADEEKISRFIIKPLIELNSSYNEEPDTEMLLKKLINEGIQNSEIQVSNTFEQAVNGIVSGETLLLVEGLEHGIVMSTYGRKYRNIDVPNTESGLSGSMEAFTESLTSNIALIRGRIKTSKLKVENLIVGRVSKTNVNILYIEDIADSHIVKTIRKKIQSIDIDSVLDIENIKEYMLKDQRTIFPLVDRSERPDKIAAQILEGKIAIGVEGSPFVLTAPTVMIEFLQTSQDYYENYFFASSVRILRYILTIISLMFPGTYLAAITFHQELVPTTLAYSIAAAREGVPFPAFVEIFIMSVMFESFREAGIRLPKQVGQAVSIVGALIIGEAAVSAKIVSPATVIVIAITGVSSFSIPSHEFGQSIRMLVFPLMFLGGFLGLYGVILGIVVLLIHLASLNSFGVSYLSPLAPFSYKDMKDTFIRSHWVNMTKRPGFLRILNRRRKSSS